MGLAIDRSPRGQRVPGESRTLPFRSLPQVLLCGHLTPCNCTESLFLTHAQVRTGRPVSWQPPSALVDPRAADTPRSPGARPALRARRQVPRRADSLGAGTGSGAGPAGAGRRRAFPAGHRAALRPARGVCTGGGLAGPMFTELRTRRAPWRGRAGLCAPGFWERRDVDGERGWIGARGYRCLRALENQKDRGGSRRTLNGPRGRNRRRVPAEPSPMSLSRAESRAGVAGAAVRAFWGSARPGLAEVTPGGSCPHASTALRSPFFFARSKSLSAPAVGPRGGQYHGRLRAPAPFPPGILTLGLEGEGLTDRRTKDGESSPGVRRKWAGPGWPKTGQRGRDFQLVIPPRGHTRRSPETERASPQDAGLE